MVSADAIIVQDIFNQIKKEVKDLPDFVDTMFKFSSELEKYWLDMNAIEKNLEALVNGFSLSRKQEDALVNLENQANELYVKILRKKIDFQRRYKPSFQMHRESKDFEKFTELVIEILEESMLPISEGLKSALRSRSEWIKARKTEKVENKLKFMTLVLTLVVLAEVFIGVAQIVPEYKTQFTIFAFLTPIFISITYYLVMFEHK